MLTYVSIGIIYQFLWLYKTKDFLRCFQDTVRSKKKDEGEEDVR